MSLSGDGLVNLKPSDAVCAGASCTLAVPQRVPPARLGDYSCCSTRTWLANRGGQGARPSPAQGLTSRYILARFALDSFNLWSTPCRPTTLQVTVSSNLKDRPAVSPPRSFLALSLSPACSETGMAQAAASAAATVSDTLHDVHFGYSFLSASEAGAGASQQDAFFSLKCEFASSLAARRRLYEI